MALVTAKASGQGPSKVDVFRTQNSTLFYTVLAGASEPSWVWPKGLGYAEQGLAMG